MVLDNKWGCYISGLNLGFCSADERCHYKVTLSLIGWEQTWYHWLRSCSAIYRKWAFNLVITLPADILASNRSYPDSKVHGANMGPIWGQQDPGGPHGGPMSLAIWVGYRQSQWWLETSQHFEWQNCSLTLNFFCETVYFLKHKCSIKYNLVKAATSLKATSGLTG